MDPEVTLQSIRQYAIEVLRGIDSNEEEPLNEHATHRLLSDAEGLAGLIISLDEWISMGGFLPTQWQAT